MMTQKKALPKDLKTQNYEEIFKAYMGFGALYHDGQLVYNGQYENGKRSGNGKEYEDGELLYFGANVSMGYAARREDLALGDLNGGRLKTGDMARMDEEGYFYITGRKKRFVKIQGRRISLDKVQEDLQEAFACEDIVCTGNDDEGITVHTSSSETASREDEILDLFMDRWQVRGRFVHIRLIDEIPRNQSGKVLYTKL